jgi:hypothetical protein
MRTISFYSHNIRISTAIGKPKMAISVIRDPQPSDWTTPDPLPQSKMVDWELVEAPPHLAAPKLSTDYVSWLELSTKVGQWSRWNPERKLWMHSAFQRLLVDCFIYVAYTIVSLTYLCDTRLSSAAAAAAETQHDAVGNSVFLYICIYGRAFCPKVTEGKEPAGACNFTKSISQTHPLGHSSASGSLRRLGSSCCWRHRRNWKRGRLQTSVRAWRCLWSCLGAWSVLKSWFRVLLTFRLNVRYIPHNIVNPTKHCYGSEECYACCDLLVDLCWFLECIP